MDEAWKWLTARRRGAKITVVPCNWSENREWRLVGGRLQHVSGRYFSIIGVRERRPDGVIRQIPMIDQPERGLLGFLVNQEAGEWHWLLQAKGEPGNVGGVQIGPTVQATLSNLECVHDGRQTLFLECLAESSMVQRGELPGVLQSEQGTRFWEKYNHNIVVELGERLAHANEDWRWVSAGVLRQLLLSSFCVNTDARSVVASADWRYVSHGRQPFARETQRAKPVAPLQELMLDSYVSSSRDIDRFRNALAAAGTLRATVWPLDALDGWGFTSDAFQHRRGDHSSQILSFNVSAPRREVSRWQQPLVADGIADRVVLLTAVINGEFRVALSIADELGFQGNAKFGPSWQNALDQSFTPIRSLGEQIWSIEQSDEGGRFNQIVVGYEWRHMNDGRVPQQDLNWVSLAELEALCRAPGMTTNELRTVVTLLLALAA